MEFATPNHRPSFAGWDNTADASVTMAGCQVESSAGLCCDKVCRMAHSCDTFVFSSLIAVIPVALKIHLIPLAFGQ
jgi:hypothetical protein